MLLFPTDLINENPDDIRRNLLTAASVEGRTYMNKYPGINGKTAVKQYSCNPSVRYLFDCC